MTEIAPFCDIPDDLEVFFATRPPRPDRKYLDETVFTPEMLVALGAHVASYHTDPRLIPTDKEPEGE